MARIARKNPKHWHHRALRQALMSAALETIEEEGVQALAIRKLALRTGVSPAAPYHHFASRQALLAELAAEGFTLLRQSMLEHAAGARDPVARLAGLGRGYVRFARTHVAHFRVMFLVEVKRVEHEALARESTAALALLEEVVLACQSAGLAPTGAPRPLVLVAWSAVHGMAHLLADGSLEHEPALSASLIDRTVADTIASLFRAARGAPLD